MSEVGELKGRIERQQDLQCKLNADFGVNERAVGYGMALRWVICMIEEIENERTDSLQK